MCSADDHVVLLALIQSLKYSKARSIAANSFGCCGKKTLFRTTHRQHCGWGTRVRSELTIALFPREDVIYLMARVRLWYQRASSS